MAFQKFLKRAGFTGELPKVVPCGSRNETFDSFRTARREPKPGDILLLVDSEDPVSGTAIEHLRNHDKWIFDCDVTENQVHLMVTSMETWLVVDRGALSSQFGSKLRMSALPPLENLEIRPRSEVLKSLQSATAECGRGRGYQKGETSFRVLERVDPAALEQYLPHCKRLLDALRDKCP